MSDGDTNTPFRLEDWLVQPSLNRLSDGDHVVTLEPRVMGVLVCLASRAGRTVSADDLLDTIWQGRAHGGNTVYQAVADLRKALRDDVNRPCYIETIAKKGYRLICPVVSVATDDELQASIRARFARRSVAVIAGVSLLAVAIILTVQPELPDRTLQTDDGPGNRSIAVLPFINMSDGPDSDYFSDGLSEEIMTLLANIPGLKVIGRTSSFAFKGKDEDLRVIGQKLGVNTVLEGSVRKSGNRVRITAQLIDVSDGTHIWTESYDRAMTDIFAVQDDVAAAIIDALGIHVGDTPVRGRPTENTEAYALFLKARSLISAFDYPDAEALLLMAIEIDPKFAEAYELLAANYFHMAGNFTKAAEGQKLMGEAAAKALAIDPNLVLARALYQAGNIENWSYASEIDAFERALREQPNNPELLYGLAWGLSVTGYLREALGIAKRNADLDPLLKSANMRLAEALYAVGSTSEATAVLELQVKLGNDDAAVLLGLINLTAKQDDIAVEYFEASGRKSYFWDTNSVREFVSRARDPVTGQAYLDRHIAETVASVPEEFAYHVSWDAMMWYLNFGYLDRFFELILATDLNASYWADADMSIKIGIQRRRHGFTAHPKYLEVAKAIGIMDVWEQRGPPDFCEKVDGQWVCE
jgi:TolB-like protein